MRTSHKAKDAAAEKQSYACDTFTGHGKAHQPPLPGSPVCVLPVMLPGKAGEGAAGDPVRDGGGGDTPGPAAGCWVNRPLDEFTAGAVHGYLNFRNRRWPATTSPYLLITRKTAHTGQPVSVFWMNRLSRGLPVTAEQLRDDRIIEEALAGPADPLHLAAVFGFGPRTGLRYADAARGSPERPATPS